MAKPHSSVVTFFVTFGFIFGGAALGVGLAHWCAPNSSILAILSFLAFAKTGLLPFPEEA
jgi:hypothetical protein